jgi:nitric-oxide synthase
MRLEIAGISYPAAPFSGPYTAAEIGGRNFGDADRYNLLDQVARVMGLETSSDRTLWKDRAMVELTAAVLHSFDMAGVKILDHHMACRHFAHHERREREAGRETRADWRRIIPALSPTSTLVFQRHYAETVVTPNFFAQPNPW